MPPVTQALLIANVVVFLLQAGSGLPLDFWFALWPPGSPMFEPWQVVTYGFLHGDITHLVFNLYGIFLFGAAVELLFGPRFYALFYFACVVAAGICHMAVGSLLGTPSSVVGASGGLFGLMLAFGWYFPRQQLSVMFLPPIDARSAVTMFAVLELVYGVIGTRDGIAHFAHLGGMLGGWLMIEYRKRGGGRR